MLLHFYDVFFLPCRRKLGIQLVQIVWKCWFIIWTSLTDYNGSVNVRCCFQGMARSWELSHCKHSCHILANIWFTWKRKLLNDARSYGQSFQKDLLWNLHWATVPCQFVSRVEKESASVDGQNNLGLLSQEGKCFSMASYTVSSFSCAVLASQNTNGFNCGLNLHPNRLVSLFPKRRYISRQKL